MQDHGCSFPSTAAPDPGELDSIETGVTNEADEVVVSMTETAGRA